MRHAHTHCTAANSVSDATAASDTLRNLIRVISLPFISHVLSTAKVIISAANFSAVNTS